MLTLDLRKMGPSLRMDDVLRAKYLCYREDVPDIEIVISPPQMSNLKRDLRQKGYLHDRDTNINKLFGMSFKIDRALR